jgi:hypothetical protein
MLVRQNCGLLIDLPPKLGVAATRPEGSLTTQATLPVSTRPKTREAVVIDDVRSVSLNTEKAGFETNTFTSFLLASRGVNSFQSRRSILATRRALPDERRGCTRVVGCCAMRQAGGHLWREIRQVPLLRYGFADQKVTNRAITETG